jgi:prophage regulatory protein
MPRLIKLNEVLKITGLSKSSVYRLINQKDFPEQIRIIDNRVGWIESEVDDWVQSRIAASRDTHIVLKTG